MNIKKLAVEDFGPIKKADVTFGDMTIFVGPQATGKSLFLQLVKLLQDASFIRNEMRRFNLVWSNQEEFNQLFFGEGMNDLGTRDSFRCRLNGENINLKKIFRGPGRDHEKMFYIPAQRVLAIRDGTTRPFTDYRTGDPYIVRSFSERLHHLLQLEFAQGTSLLFPQSGRLKKAIRTLLQDAVFNDFELKSETARMQRRFVLRKMGTTKALPFLVWSAGQREFVPLLMGLYWLMPPSKSKLRGNLKWAIVEEPEMGLHPRAIIAVMAAMLELLLRGYKVVLSTHSPQVLDVAWAIRNILENNGSHAEINELFGSRMINKKLWDKNVMQKKSWRVYYFKPDGNIDEISALDPGAESESESGWGGLTEFSGKMAHIVARVVSRNKKVI